jgi:hypothetical protein
MRVLTTAPDEVRELLTHWTEGSSLVVVAICAAWCDSCNEFRTSFERTPKAIDIAPSAGTISTSTYAEISTLVPSDAGDLSRRRVAALWRVTAARARSRAWSTK